MITILSNVNITRMLIQVSAANFFSLFYLLFCLGFAMFSSFGSFFDGIDGIADAFPDAKKYEGTDAGP